MVCWQHHCGLELKPDDVVVQGELVDPNIVTARPIGIVVAHERHWPPSMLKWRVIYRGPLQGIQRDGMD